MRKMLLISPEFLAKLRGHGGHTKQAREKAVEALKAKLPPDQRWLHFRKHLNKYLDLGTRKFSNTNLGAEKAGCEKE